jgi:hypothetical protein
MTLAALAYDDAKGLGNLIATALASKGPFAWVWVPATWLRWRPQR